MTSTSGIVNVLRSLANLFFYLIYFSKRSVLTRTSEYPFYGSSTILKTCFNCKNFEGLLLLKRHQFEVNFANTLTRSLPCNFRKFWRKKNFSLFSDPARQNVKIKSQFQWTSTLQWKRRRNVLVLFFFRLLRVSFS